jgi:hypothetical protein
VVLLFRSHLNNLCDYRNLGGLWLHTQMSTLNCENNLGAGRGAASERTRWLLQPMTAAEERCTARGISADSVVADSLRPRQPLRHSLTAMRMYYNGRVFKAVQDSEWSASHIAAHGVTLDEVREAILERPYWAAPGREGTILAYGRTYAGRYLLVVAIDENGAAFIVTARDMTDAEKRTFRRKAR